MTAYCEMCGKQTQMVNKVRIDGSILNTCEDCSKFGTPVDSLKSARNIRIPEAHNAVQIPVKTRPVPMPKPHMKQRRTEDVEKYQIDPDYAEIIRNARTRLAITQDELALKVLERKNVIANVERGVLMPEIRVAKKLERLLGIKILIKDE